MARSSTKWVLAAVLGGAAWAFSASPAPAQYMPFVGGGFRPGIMPFMGSPFMGSPYTMGLGYGTSYSTYNPYLGGVVNYQYMPPYRSTLYGLSLYNPYTGGVTQYQNYIPYMPLNGYGSGGYGMGGYGYGSGNQITSWYGSYGSSYPAYNPIVQQQLRALGRHGYGGGYGGGYSTAKPYTATATNYDTDKAYKPASGDKYPAAVDPKLITASGDAVKSGKVLNELAAAIRKLEAKGAKAESPLFPPEVIAQTAFTGPAADLLAVTRSGRPGTPEALKAPRFAEVRGELEKSATALVDARAAGKGVPAAADRLAEAVRKGREKVNAAKDLPAGDAAAAKKYLDGLDKLAKAAKDPALAAVSPPAGANVGMTAAELLRYMDKNKLSFAPAPVGAEEAYAALHRGLAGYYVALAQAKR